ncbi:MAG: hypothetical protein KBC94_23125 [Pseudacidovorax sp.]|uniref:hypothetical protein n=1 Tax=Pseudacidovorax sp. TaxID=1934311 RepID=UPI001B5AA5CB|nr:hypothetical protein [Pseudacidovorax sp.]MBP6897319.1 hypothetical protein [Pseudacidovorax sp.]
MRDNEALRALFSLPPISESASTAIVVPFMPPQRVVTGDNEVDAVLWLQEVAATGSQALIDKALEAARLIPTPISVIEERYRRFMMANHPQDALRIALSTFGFGDIQAIGRRALDRAQRQHDALSRFGSEAALMDSTPAEEECMAALRGMRATKARHYRYDLAKACERFAASPRLAPATVADCLHVRAYWHGLYVLRNAFPSSGDPGPEADAHDEYAFGLLASITPRSRAEALAVLDHLQVTDRMDHYDSDAILQNLIGAPWAANSQPATTRPSASPPQSRGQPP